MSRECGGESVTEAVNKRLYAKGTNKTVSWQVSEAVVTTTKQIRRKREEEKLTPPFPDSGSVLLEEVVACSRFRDLNEALVPVDVSGAGLLPRLFDDEEGSGTVTTSAVRMTGAREDVLADAVEIVEADLRSGTTVAGLALLFVLDATVLLEEPEGGAVVNVEEPVALSVVVRDTFEGVFAWALIGIGFVTRSDSEDPAVDMDEVRWGTKRAGTAVEGANDADDDDDEWKDTWTVGLWLGSLVLALLPTAPRGTFGDVERCGIWRSWTGAADADADADVAAEEGEVLCGNDDDKGDER